MHLLDVSCPELGTSLVSYRKAWRLPKGLWFVLKWWVVICWGCVLLTSMENREVLLAAAEDWQVQEAQWNLGNKFLGIRWCGRALDVGQDRKVGAPLHPLSHLESVQPTSFHAAIPVKPWWNFMSTVDLLCNDVLASSSSSSSSSSSPFPFLCPHVTWYLPGYRESEFVMSPTNWGFLLWCWSSLSMLRRDIRQITTSKFLTQRQVVLPYSGRRRIQSLCCAKEKKQKHVRGNPWKKGCDIYQIRSTMTCSVWDSNLQAENLNDPIFDQKY